MSSVPVSRTRRPAVAAVELAFMMPFLVTLLVGLWEIGRYAMVQNVLDSAANQGARLAANGGYFSSSNTDDPITDLMIQGTYSTDSSGNAVNFDIQKRVLTFLSAAGLNTTGASVTVANLSQNTSGTWPAGTTTGSYDPAAAATQLDHLRVTVTLPYSSVQWSTLGMFVSNSANLTAVADYYSLRNSSVSISTTIPQQVQ